MDYSFYISFPTYIPHVMGGSACIFVDGKGNQGFSVKEELKVQLPIQDKSYKIILRIGKTEICGYQKVEIFGHGYKSEASARNSWGKIKNILAVAFARHWIAAGFMVPTGVEITFSQEVLESLEITYGKKIVPYNERKLCVHESPQSEHTHMYFTGEPKYSIGFTVDKFENTFKQSFCSTNFLTEKEILSLELFNTALFQSNSKIQFLTFMTAIEALIECKPRSYDTCAYVEMLTKLTEDCTFISDEDKRSMKGSLGWLRDESIGQAGRRIVKERLGNRMYAGMSAENYFKKCYDIRSKLVHSGKLDDCEQFDKICCRLIGFVSDLITIPIIGSPDEVIAINNAQ